MTPEEITTTLKELFSSEVQTPAPGLWQVETPQMRLIVLLSEDQSWLQVLVPIVSAQEAQPFLEQLLEANFNDTQETRYALHQGVIWGVFQHSCQSLTTPDFSAAVERLLFMHQRGLSDCFNQLIEGRIRQIIQAAKLQGQSLKATLQNLDRFYEEGLMGEMDQGAESREAVLAAWRRQLERLWQEVEP
ncbi:MAG: hypothetical protein KME08_05410 [Aphanothece sp. CMT-3BRIN-NPC111]|jgi:hypothetical protein|nr:hypothetical protein [Aphanothece sp. CMT-3BRIN-NPC111]